MKESQIKEILQAALEESIKEMFKDHMGSLKDNENEDDEEDSEENCDCESDKSYNEKAAQITFEIIKTLSSSFGDKGVNVGVASKALAASIYETVLMVKRTVNHDRFIKCSDEIINILEFLIKNINKLQKQKGNK